MAVPYAGLVIHGDVDPPHPDQGGNCMRNILRVLRMLFVSMLAAAGLAVASAAPAQAANTDAFSVCVSAFCSLSYTDGTITWYNRTANVAGKVVDIGSGSTQAIFKAYAGTTQIGLTETRTANDESSLGSPRSFNFGMGDSNLVGGINRITIQVCALDGTVCSPVHTYIK